MTRVLVFFMVTLWCQPLDLSFLHYQSPSKSANSPTLFSTNLDRGLLHEIRPLSTRRALRRSRLAQSLRHRRRWAESLSSRSFHRLGKRREGRAVASAEDAEKEAAALLRAKAIPADKDSGVSPDLVHARIAYVGGFVVTEDVTEGVSKGEKEWTYVFLGSFAAAEEIYKSISSVRMSIKATP
ncbi:hypothetical protein U1Q18_052062 [Sarracenia purpurea var. burkii]